MKNKLILFFATLLCTFSSGSVFSETSEKIHYIIPNQLKWESTPALPKNIQVAILFGDPNRDAPLVMRLKIPAGTKIAPHWHPIDENITVLTGSLNVGMGDNFETANGAKFPTGSFISIPAKHHHYAWFTEDTVLQLNNFGRWQIIYVNPKDDPRNK